MTNPYIDVLVGSSWLDEGGDSHITYFLDDSGSRAWTGGEAAAFGLAVQSWANVAGITFERVFTEDDADLSEGLYSTAAMIDFGFSDSTLGAHEFPFWYGPSYGYFNSEGAINEFGIGYSGAPQPGSLQFETLVHELGHALGLNHPHPDSASDPAFPGVTDAFDIGDNDLNQNVYTAMSYNELGWPFTATLTGHAAGPMAFDIAAIQEMYGPNTTYQIGDSVYLLDGMIGTTAKWQCIWDAGGTDSIQYSGSSGVTIDLRAATLESAPGGGGYLSSFNAILPFGGFTIANGVIIEKAYGGSGNDNLTGNSADNYLYGGDGADILDGGAGADEMRGGDGDDTYYVDDAADVIFDLDGHNTVNSSVSYLLVDGLGDLFLVGPDAINGIGNFSDNRLVGNDAANTLEGGGGKDVLEGGDGIDTLIGGEGDDTYVLSQFGDIATEAADEGTDTLQAFFGIDLVNFLNFENVVLTGLMGVSVYGNDEDNVLTGNDAANTLEGKDGDDTLIGGGGIDSLIGGDGDDTFVLNADDDNITDDDGSDTIVSTVNRSLVGYGSIENLRLDGTGNINATGNGLANILTGNTGDNILDGGAGADTLIGGGGNDTYMIYDVFDTISETDPETLGGIDTVVANTSDVSYDLGANLENLVLMGLATVTGRGNDLGNTLTGNDLDNTLEGGLGNDILSGGLGVDTLIGGEGDDTYVLADADDIITEASNEGSDTVEVAQSYVLSDSISIENITLAGLGALDATGNAGVNRLIGNSGANILDGMADADRMEGGAGNDTYYIDNAGDVFVEDIADIQLGGVDTVYSSISGVVLGSNVEMLRLTEAAGAGAAYGNGQTNSLYGNSFANILSGLGGADLMYGGDGGDTYSVDNIFDQVFETIAGTAGGRDVVNSTVSFALSENVEDLTLLGLHVNGIGNTLNNTITGSAGNNILEGGGGDDLLIGGAGNDRYNLLDSTFDTVIDESGIDTIVSFASRSLMSYAAIENLDLSIGTATSAGTGNALNNTITGGAGSNKLSGLGGNDILTGGTGRDIMTGGAGLDDFDFNLIAETGKTAAKRDIIKDFTHLLDDIDLRTIDANGSAAGNTAFKFLAAKGAAFAGVKGQLHWFQINAAGTAADKTIIEGDINGDRIADFQIELTGLKTLTAGDFFL